MIVGEKVKPDKWESVQVRDLWSPKESGIPCNTCHDSVNDPFFFHEKSS
jgi:hypothetical protein